MRNSRVIRCAQLDITDPLNAKLIAEKYWFASPAAEHPKAGSAQKDIKVSAAYWLREEVVMLLERTTGLVRFIEVDFATGDRLTGMYEPCHMCRCSHAQFFVSVARHIERQLAEFFEIHSHARALSLSDTRASATSLRAFASSRARLSARKKTVLMPAVPKAPVIRHQNVTLTLQLARRTSTARKTTARQPWRASKQRERRVTCS